MGSVLYLSYDGMTDPLGQSQVLPYLKGLTKAGYTVHLVSYEKPDRFLKHRKHIQRICDDAAIIWHPQDYVVSGSILTTVRQVQKMKKIAFYLHDRHNFSIVHCRSYISALAGLKLKRKRGTKFIFDMRGFWADERVDGGLWNLKNPVFKTIYKYFKRKELLFFTESDYTISLTYNGKREIESWPELKQNPPNIEVIPCCVDLDLFNPDAISNDRKNELRERLNLKPTDFVLGYVGSIGTWYMLSEMLDYFKELQHTNPNAKFLFITGEKPFSIKEMAAKKGIDRSKLLITSCLHSQVALHISIFDESIFFIRSTFSKKASSPTKQGEIMAMGVPLVCNSGVGDTDEIVLTYHSGKVITEFTNAAYAETINSPEQFDPKSIAEGAKAYFSLEEGTQRYLNVYQALENG